MRMRTFEILKTMEQEVRGLCDENIIEVDEFDESIIRQAARTLYMFVPALPDGCVKVSNDYSETLSRFHDISVTPNEVSFNMRLYFSGWLENILFPMSCIWEGRVIVRDRRGGHSLNCVTNSTLLDAFAKVRTDRNASIDKKFLKRFLEEHIVKMRDDLIVRTFSAILEINWLLQSQTHQVSQANGTWIFTEYENCLKRRIRTISGIRIRSKKKPTVHSTTKERKSHLDGWPRRGHFRTYPSGKKAYIPPTYCYRKGRSENSVAPVTLR